MRIPRAVAQMPSRAPGRVKPQVPLAKSGGDRHYVQLHRCNYTGRSEHGAVDADPVPTCPRGAPRSPDRTDTPTERHERTTRPHSEVRPGWTRPQGSLAPTGGSGPEGNP